VSGWGCSPLAGRRGHVGSGGKSFLLVVLRMFHPVSLGPMHGVIVVYCLIDVHAFTIRDVV
jgi:hypothetical protein